MDGKPHALRFGQKRLLRAVDALEKVAGKDGPCCEIGKGVARLALADIEAMFKESNNA